MPTVSVIMSVYNGEAYLRDAVRSILFQTYDDFEFIIIDDGSSDGSGAFLDSVSAQDSRIRLVHQENRGLIASLNRALGLAQGRYVARMDADDLSKPDRLAKQVAALERDPAAILATCEVDVINRRGRVIDRLERYADSEIAGWHLLFHNFIGGHGQVVFRRDAVLSVGGYSEDAKLCEDYDLWCRLWPRGRFMFLPEALYAYRWHDESVSRQHADNQVLGSLGTSRRHIFDRLGIDLEFDQVTRLRSFWARWTPFDRSQFLILSDSNALEESLRRLYSAYLDSSDGHALTNRQRVLLRRSVGIRYLRWIYASFATASRSELLRLSRLALAWSPLAFADAAREVAHKKLLRDRRIRNQQPTSPPAMVKPE